MNARLAWSAAVLMLAGGAMAQPPADRPPPDERPGAIQPEDRAAFRARLERAAAESKRRWERLEAAIRRLDGGASVDDVRRETETPGPRGEGRGPRPGPRGDEPRTGEPRRGPEPANDGERLSREEVLSLLETMNATFAAKIKEAMTENPAMAGRILDRMEPMVREIKSERDPEMKGLRIRDLTLGFELVGATRAFVEARRADPESQATKEAETKLRGLFAEHFDLRTQMHRQEIVSLERRIGQIREDLDRQLSNRETMIERRMEDVKRGFRGRGEPRREGEPKRDGGTPERREPEGKRSPR
ncbi:MAG: hypothetical protein KF678_10850 [Phycisphaeraceae bacterium]|nr:hypothetical protein [Phycisphaeraceae bacterium]